MSEPTTSSGQSHKRKSQTAAWLRVLGMTAGVLVVLGGAVRIIATTESTSGKALADWAWLAEIALYVASAMVLGGVLVGLSSLLRLLRELHASFTRLELYQYEQKETAPAAGEVEHASPSDAMTPGKADLAESTAGTAGPWREMLTILEDLRENSLLSREERMDKRLRLADEEIHDAMVKIRSLTQEGEFAQAREIAAAMRRKYPNDERAEDQVEQVESSRERRESQDVESCTDQVNDLISISAWGRARELAQQLQQRHPDAIEARRLLLRIESEHRLFQEEQRRRMNAEVQRFVTRRRWEEALAAAKAFIERFPGSEEAEAFRMQIPTLEGNAEIEIRQRLEARIMDYVRHGRYIEAVELAGKVIEQFPDSPQAEELRKQIGRLKDLADNPEAPPARIKVD